MSNASEYDVGRWIKSTLEAASVGVETYLDVIPREADMPAVKMTCQSRNDVRTNAQHIAISTFRFLVLAVSFDHQMEAVAALARSVDDALHLATGGDDRMTILACTRVQTFSMTSPEQGGLYRLGGGLYEIVTGPPLPPPVVSGLDSGNGSIADALDFIKEALTGDATVAVLAWDNDTAGGGEPSPIGSWGWSAGSGITDCVLRGWYAWDADDDFECLHFTVSGVDKQLLIMKSDRWDCSASESIEESSEPTWTGDPVAYIGGLA